MTDLNLKYNNISKTAICMYEFGALCKAKQRKAYLTWKIAGSYNVYGHQRVIYESLFPSAYIPYNIRPKRHENSVARMSRRETVSFQNVCKFGASLDLQWQWIFSIYERQKKNTQTHNVICKERNIILCGLHSLRII